MSIDEAPCEAFSLMHILELPIDGHIKLNKKLFLSDILDKIYNTNASVPVASLKDSHDNYNINTQNDIIYQYLSLPWQAFYYITISYGRTCIMCMSSSTTYIAVCYEPFVWIFIDEVFSDVCWETLETVRSNFFVEGVSELSWPF